MTKEEFELHDDGEWWVCSGCGYATNSLENAARHHAATGHRVYPGIRAENVLADRVRSL